jgi:hypothetical protein
MFMVVALTLMGCSSQVADGNGGAGGSGGSEATGGSGGAGDAEVPCPEGGGLAAQDAQEIEGKPCGEQAACTITGFCDWCQMSCVDGVWVIGTCDNLGPSC